MSRDSAQKSRPGFTLIELLVTLMIVGVLSALVFAMVAKSRSQARALRCLSNQQQISQALMGFYADHTRFPSGNPDEDLALQLHDYIPWEESRRSVSLPEVWRCPKDRGGPLSNSYAPYYVQPQTVADSETFVLGCPRHDDTSDGFIITRGIHATARVMSRDVNVNGTTVGLEADVADRSMSSGTMRFDDGSTATVTSGEAGYRVSSVASFRMENGNLYTVVRVQGKGETAFDVTQGSRFYVITPVALIGVRGTEFLVCSGTNYTRVALQSGKVRVAGRDMMGYKVTGGGTKGEGTGEENRQVGRIFAMSPGDVVVFGKLGYDSDEQRLVLTLDKQAPNGKWNKWKVVNPNTFDVKFTWDDCGGGEGGSDVVKGEKHTKFKTYDNVCHETVRIFYELPETGLHSETATAN